MKKIEKEQIVKSIEQANPWWKNPSANPFQKLPRRTHFSRLYDLVSRNDPKRALILMGPRRIGKTVLLYQIIGRLINEGRSEKKIMYLSLDNPIFRLSGLEELLLWGLDWAGSTPDDATVFFDEIQYLETWEQQLKVLVDNYPNTKFIATGSAAAALHKKSRESGAGRFTDYLLPPLSFYEYIFIKGKLEQTPPQSVDMQKMNSLYLEYLNHGGFPESISSEALRDQPEQYIGQDILDKVLGRDLPSMFGLNNPNELHRLFAALVYNTSNEVSPDAISKQAGVPKAEINKYIAFFETAFLIRVVEKTDHTIKNFQRRTHFKVVLTNPSLRSAIFGKLSADDRELEALAETAIFSQLIIHEGSFPSYKYARWSKGGSKGEVDLVHVNLKGEATAALEIKWSNRFAMSEEKPRSLISFCRENGLKRAFMTSKSLFAETQHGELRVSHFPTSYLCFVLGFLGGFAETVRHYKNDPIGDDPKEANPWSYLKSELTDPIVSAIEAVTELMSTKRKNEKPGVTRKTTGDASNK